MPVRFKLTEFVPNSPKNGFAPLGVVLVVVTDHSAPGVVPKLLL